MVYSSDFDAKMRVTAGF